MYILLDKVFGIRTDIIFSKSHNIIYMFDFGFGDGYITNNTAINAVSSRGVGILLALLLFSLKDIYTKR